MEEGLAVDGKPGMTMDISDLTYGILGANKKVKRLLKRVNLSLSSPSMCALMGPSGAGKSTLLDVMADRKLVGTWSGDIFIDGRPRSEMFRRRTAYVLQDDIHIPTLTVEEILYFSCWTRAANLKTKEEIQDRVSSLLTMVGLEHVRGSIVGDSMKKGISGGQLKRLSIAQELVTLPDVIFLDEPTSGLDSAISLEVMSAVKKLVGRDKLCVSTIHQPSPQVFAMFDKLVLMSAGRIVFFGDSMDCVDYFTSPGLGYMYAKDSNPAEFVIAVGGGSLLPAGGKSPRQPEELEALYNSSKFYQPFGLHSAKNYGSAAISAGESVLERTTFWTQTQMLVARNWLSRVRDVTDLQAQLAKNVVLGLLIGTVFYGQGDVDSPFYTNGVANAQVYSCCSIFFFTMMFMVMVNLQAVSYLCMQNVIYKREMASGAYTTGPYWISQLVTGLPLNFLFHTIFVVILYFLVRFPVNVDYFVYFWILLFFGNTCSYYSMVWLAAQSGRESLAYAVFPILFLLQSNFSGYALTLDNVPPLWCWAPYLDYVRWVFEGLMVNQWSQYDTDDAPVENGNGNVLNQYGFEGFDQNNAYWIVLLFSGGFALMAYFAMLPPKKKLVHLQVEDVSESALQSIAVQSKTKPSLTTAMQNDSARFIRESFLGLDTTHDELEEPLQLQPSLNVDFYRVSTGNFERAEGCHLVFNNVCYDVPNRSNPGERSRLLSSVSGQVSPGEMCALMGASGAGKSTLLDVLAGRKNTGTIEGEILYNGSPALRAAAYVMQDNVHIPLLSVRQNLYFAAQLRLPEHWSIEKKEQRVRKILDMLGLTEVANTLVGNESVRGISGGQMRRLSIAVEIINLPNVIFLDEPTTGLDSSIALEVVSALRNLAHQNRTIICTIHQPSQKSFDLFDTILLLTSGRVIFFGAVRDCAQFFVDCPYHFPYENNSNAADFVVAVAGSSVASSSGEMISGSTLADYYQSTQTATFKSMTLSPALNLAMEGVAPKSVVSQEEVEVRALEMKRYNTSTYHQVKTLLHRSFLKTFKDKAMTVAVTGRHIIVGLFYGSLYFQLHTGTDSTDYSNRSAIFFFALINMTIGHQPMIPIVLEDRLLFYRERGARAYGALSYWLSSWLVHVPLIMVNTLLFAVILYNLSGMRGGAPHFGYFYFFLVVTSGCGFLIASFTGAIASSTQAAMSYYPVVLLFSVCFAGYLIYIPNFPSWLGGWAPYLSFLRYAFEGLALNEFVDNSELPSSGSYLGELGFGDNFSKADCAVILWVWFLFFLVVYFLALRFLDFEER